LFAALGIAIGRVIGKCYPRHRASSWTRSKPTYPTTSASWLNQVERFFALITERKIRRGIYRSAAALHADIMCFLDQQNADPAPFRCTKSADDILASIERFCLCNPPQLNREPANF
jgi:hypothetical protein